MSVIKKHCDDCLKLLGKNFQYTHEWLDQYVRIFDAGTFQDYHRSFLHNSYGLEIAKAKWGDEAEKAAKIHLARDFDDQALIEKLPGLANRAIIWFNNLTNMEVYMHPSVIKRWNSESLVSIAQSGR